MNPIHLTNQLKQSLVRYLLTTYDVNRDGQNAELRHAIWEAFEREQALFSGPFLELSLPYQRGKSIRQLIQDGTLSPKFAALKHPPIPLDAPLYLHQETAIQRITAGNSVIVSSGTGSGKTESFLIPILNDLLTDSRKGVRAVLIYPLNALVNDQLDRLRNLLRGTGITFGRYTSELAQTTRDAERQIRNENIEQHENEVISREQIRNGRLPQILITNYAMLEYLMLRPEDSPLFQHPDVWKFIVLDEAHSYAGAQGIEVAYLVRRLKHRLGKERGDMRCIGTSATLTDDPKQAIQFAETLFGETLTEHDIIFGQEQPIASNDSATPHTPDLLAYLMPDLQELIDKFQEGNEPTAEEIARRLQLLDFVDKSTKLDYSNPSAMLYSALRNNTHLRDLRNLMLENRDLPLPVEMAAKAVFGPHDPQNELVDDWTLALSRLIALGSHARIDSDQPPLVPARYHLFARSPQGMWVCLNPQCSGRGEQHRHGWSRLFSNPRLTCDQCGCAVYPLVVCRTCGQVYLKTAYDSKTGKYETEALAEETARYFVWSRVDENSALGDDETDDEDATTTANDKYPVVGKSPIQFCLNDNCRKEVHRCSCTEPKQARLYPVEQHQEGVGKSRTEWVSHLHQCARCRSKSRVDIDEIATPITISGSTPLAVLTTELYRQLPESSGEALREKPGNGRKLLSFYDSRQGAARYAAFLQDVHNQDLYRYLIPEGIKNLAPKTVDLDLLSERCAKIGWDTLRVFQNALDEGFERLINDVIDAQSEKAWQSLDRKDRDKIIDMVKARILAELTVSRRGRQSLESLGLITLSYFETPPDVSTLSHKIGLNETQTRNLIDDLLDTLRDEKAVTLPEDVERDHPFFGRHEGNPFVVRGNAGKSEVSWVGKTERHRRCKLMRVALQAAKQPDDFKSIETALQQIWDWLTSEHSNVLRSFSGGQFQLSSHCFILETTSLNWYRCERCQRLRHGPLALPCPAKNCGGQFQPIDLRSLNNENYYFRVLSQPLIPMRVEEHTAQLSPERGREYQNRFKRGDINILSCSTTFEMGIDLGDLQAVIMNNVPPTVSSYRQRAGRAGRRIGGVAFIVTWASDRPHDQIYFNKPPEMIRGKVRIPRLTLDNPEIRRRHLNALLMADFFSDLVQQGRTNWGNVGAFFDPNDAQQHHYAQLETWLNARREVLQNILKRFALLLGDLSLNSETTIDELRNDMRQAKHRYDEASQYYKTQQTQAKAKYMNASGREADEADKDRRRFEALLKRLNDSLIIDSLSDKSILPSYSFPLYTVELELPYTEKNRGNLRLQRDLRRAITEYAPGSEVVADKRLWVSGGVRILRDAPQRFAYRLCETCNHLSSARTAGDNLNSETQCPVCGTGYMPLVLNAQYLVPDGFKADAKESGKLAGQYVRRGAKRQKVAVTIPEMDTADEKTVSWTRLQYKRDGRLLYLNEGAEGKGYALCMKCGQHVIKKGAQQCPICAGKVERVNLGHEISTDTLSIRFDPPVTVSLPSNTDKDFWYTLQTALVLGATYALQIERGDIGGMLFPFSTDKDWQQTVVLYDDVPGGAGYMRDVRENFGAVVQAALEIARCASCDEATSCTHCLRDYSNQEYYEFLKRGRVISFLEQLHTSLTTAADPLGVAPLIATNPIHTLMDAITNARHSIRLAVATIDDESPAGERDSWLDVLHDRLRAGIKIEFLVKNLPTPTRDSIETLRIADYLRLLMTTGKNFSLYKVSSLPDWHIIIDSESTPTSRAFQFVSSDPRLNGALTSLMLNTTTQENGIQVALNDFEANRRSGKRATLDMLELPPRTKVYRIASGVSKRGERDIPAIVEFFERPVTEMFVIDPYLADTERIVNRLGAYISLAQAKGALTRVTVETRDAALIPNGDRQTQSEAFEKLKKKFTGIQIETKRPPRHDLHDRWIKIVRTDQSEAIMYIGRGLDFIRPDGTVQATYIVIDEGTT